MYIMGVVLGVCDFVSFTTCVCGRVLSMKDSWTVSTSQLKEQMTQLHEWGWTQEVLIFYIFSCWGDEDLWMRNTLSQFSFLLNLPIKLIPLVRWLNNEPLQHHVGWCRGQCCTVRHLRCSVPSPCIQIHFVCAHCSACLPFTSCRKMKADKCKTVVWKEPTRSPGTYGDVCALVRWWRCVHTRSTCCKW